MKNVLIPYELFLELTLHHLNGIDGFENDIRRGLTKKVMRSSTVSCTPSTRPRRPKRSANKPDRNT